MEAGGSTPAGLPAGDPFQGGADDGVGGTVLADDGVGGAVAADDGAGGAVAAASGGAASDPRAYRDNENYY